MTYSLLSGNSASIASAVLGMDVREAVLSHLLEQIDRKCGKLCQKVTASHFRTIPTEELHTFKWLHLVAELESSSPLLFRALSTIAGHDRRNKTKVGPAHFPGICTAAAVILKERNREMCGLQSLVSLVMYTCHGEKQV